MFALYYDIRCHFNYFLQIVILKNMCNVPIVNLIQFSEKCDSKFPAGELEAGSVMRDISAR